MSYDPLPPARPEEGLAPRAALKKPFVGRLAGAVAAHAYMSLAVIIVLTLLAVGLYVYYHGLFFLGPYAAGKRARGGSKKKDRDAGAGDGEGEGDPETERLIDSINQH